MLVCTFLGVSVCPVAESARRATIRRRQLRDAADRFQPRLAFSTQILCLRVQSGSTLGQRGMHTVLWSDRVLRRYCSDGFNRRTWLLQRRERKSPASNVAKQWFSETWKQIMCATMKVVCQSTSNHPKCSGVIQPSSSYNRSHFSCHFIRRRQKKKFCCRVCVCVSVFN